MCLDICPELRQHPHFAQNWSSIIETIDLSHDTLHFTAFTKGHGPIVFLLHGFPDTALTFRHQIEGLSNAGYRCVAPMMRGYEPGSQPADHDYAIETIAADVVAWADELGADRFHLVGHDWGAVAAYIAGAIELPPLPQWRFRMRRNLVMAL